MTVQGVLTIASSVGGSRAVVRAAMQYRQVAVLSDELVGPCWPEPRLGGHTLVGLITPYDIAGCALVLAECVHVWSNRQLSR